MDAFILLILVTISLGFSSHVILNNSEQTGRKKALKSAEIISAQLMSFSLKNIQGQREKVVRDIASSPESSVEAIDSLALGPEGIIGKDPWGRPFNYRFVSAPSGDFEFLMVWSHGPDGRAKIDYASIGAAQAANMLGDIELGDDIGRIVRTPNIR